MNRIGILGGTFDPPHLGHLIIAQEVSSALGLDEVWFIPTFQPPHKHEARTSVDERMEMINPALADNDAFVLHTIEIERAGKSYTIDTMRELKEIHPDNDFYFIIGADMVEYLPNWYKIDELIKMVKFVGVQREGYDLESTYPLQVVDIPMVAISSTLIRERLFDKKSVKYLIPDSVYHYIKELGCYGEK